MNFSILCSHCARQGADASQRASRRLHFPAGGNDKPADKGEEKKRGFGLSNLTKPGGDKKKSAQVTRLAAVATAPTPETTSSLVGRIRRFLRLETS
jgi:hypothetical protein